MQNDHAAQDPLCTKHCIMNINWCITRFTTQKTNQRLKVNVGKQTERHMGIGLPICDKFDKVPRVLSCRYLKPLLSKQSDVNKCVFCY